MISGSNGLYPLTSGAVDFGIGNTKACHTKTGKGPTSLRSFRAPGVGMFDKVVATVISSSSGPKGVALRTAKGKLTGNILGVRDG